MKSKQPISVIPKGAVQANLKSKTETKGKNFSGNNIGQRRKGDDYQTHFSMTQQLLDTGIFNKRKRILEPAAGKGAIALVLSNRGFKNITAYDIDPEDIPRMMPYRIMQQDFLKEQRSFPQIITNPPFSKAYEFVLHAKEVCTERFAYLLPLSYLHGKQRYDHIYQDQDFPLRYVYIFTRYPDMRALLREDGKYPTAMQVMAWFVWEKFSMWKEAGVVPPEPVIRWLDNNEYVLSKGE